MINENISENVKRYIAGLVAGDGNIDISKDRNSAQLKVGIFLCYKPTLDLISKTLQVGNVIKGGNKKSEKYKQRWKWLIYSNDALRFLKLIELYLPEKREQSREAIIFQNWKNKNTGSGRLLTLNDRNYCKKVIEINKQLKEQYLIIEDIEKYNFFRKQHHDTEIANGNQPTFASFDDDFDTFSKNEINDVNEAKEMISPDIDLKVIDNMTNPLFAGFFDAEGYVGISNDKRYKNNVYSLNVHIKNSNLPILKRYCDIFGGSVSDPIIDERNDSYKITWLWRVTATNALKFLEQIHLFTLEKREQIELAIEFQTRRNKNMLTQNIAEQIRKKIMDLHHTEYALDGKKYIVSYKDNNGECVDNYCFTDEYDDNRDEKQSLLN